MPKAAKTRRVARRRSQPTRILRSKLGPALPALLLTALTVGLLLMSGVPRLLAELYALPAAAAVQAMDKGGEIPNGQLTAAIAATGPLALLDARREAERGEWTLLLSKRQSANANPAATRGLATRWLKDGLAGAPLDGEFWMHLSEGLRLQNAEPALQAEALRLSFLLGPRRLNYVEWRLNLARRTTIALDEELSDWILRDVRRIWDHKPSRPFLVQLARHRKSNAWVTQAFSGRPDILQRIRLTLAVEASERVNRISGPPRPAGRP